MDTVAASMVTELTTVVSSLSTNLATIAPLAISLVGIGLVVTLGIRLFKRVANKAV